MPRGGNEENFNLDKGRQMDSGINVSEQYFRTCVSNKEHLLIENNFFCNFVFKERVTRKDYGKKKKRILYGD